MREQIAYDEHGITVTRNTDDYDEMKYAITVKGLVLLTPAEYTLMLTELLVDAKKRDWR